jgi:hypothetical protein
MKRVIFPTVILAVFVLSACTLPFTINWNTPAAQTSAPVGEPQTEAPVVYVTATPETPTFSGFETNQGGVYMVVPACLGTGATGMAMNEENPGPDMPYFAYLPAYRKITIDGYAVTNDIWKPEVNVYPVADYNALVPDDYINKEVTALQQVISNNILPASDYPFLPIENAAQVFKAQAGLISFQNGKGIGYLTELAQYVDPVNNRDIFYTFQGITNDGKYWVAVTLPVNAPFLQPSANDFTVPADGILYPQNVANPSAYDGYYADMVDKLNNTPLDTFTPSLACIKTFVESINVTN